DAISDDLKKRILNEQRNDPKLKPFFDHSQAIPPRLLRKYELIGSTDEESSFISNRITGALVVPASLCAEVALVLHDYFGPFHQAGVRAIDHASMMALICVDAFTGFMVHRVLSDHGKAP
ncbi:hypothetical protein FOL47_005693, partial [Perkinsus chesapeaki]